jgi:hypothetical protein
MPRYFTLEEARRLLPFTGRSIREAVESRQHAAEAENWLRDLSQRILLSGGMAVNTVAVEAWKAQYDTNTQSLKNAMEALEQAGVQVKDLDVGLVDFPSLYKGEEVCLCWRMDEDDITCWHGLTEGFAGRKEIDDEFLRNHRGEGLT